MYFILCAARILSYMVYTLHFDKNCTRKSLLLRGPVLTTVFPKKDVIDFLIDVLAPEDA